MKKAFATLALLTCVFTAVSQDFKKHSFGIGIGGSSFPIVKSYSDFMNNTDGFNLSNAFVTSLSLKYDYAFNAVLSLSLEPSYLNTYLSYRDAYYVTSLINNTTTLAYGSSGTSVYVHQLDIPLIANFRFPIVENVKLLAGLGASALVNFKKEINFYDEPTFSTVNGRNALSFKNSVIPEFLLRAGLEISTKHRIWLNASYHFSPIKNAYYTMLGNGSIPATDYEEMRISKLKFEFAIFL